MRARCPRLAAIAAATLTLGMFQSATAQLGNRSAEQWIEMLHRPERVESLRIDEVIERLRLKSGTVVADIGAGTGVFSLPFGEAVAPDGKVYAVEVDQGLVDHIAQRIEEAGAANVQAVLGEFTDPKLPTRQLDLAFFHNVLHHVEDRAGYLKTLAGYIKETGRIAVIERAGEHHRLGHGGMAMSEEALMSWMEDAGFELSEEYHLFGDAKRFVVFSKL